MTQNLKIEVLTGDISIDGMIVTNLVTKEELSTAIVKKADLGTDGKIPTSQLPAEIVNTAGIVDEVKLQLETSIKDAVDESIAYAESYTDDALSSKADLTSGKVPLEQLPDIDQYPQFGTALGNLSTSILSAMKQRTDQLEKSKADLGEDGKVLREQIPSYEKISGLPEQLEVMSTQTAAVSGELDEHKLQTADQIDTLKENIEANVQQLTDRQSHLMRTYATKELGVDAKVGVKPGEYFYVRSANEEEMMAEYQNIGGVASVTGKSFPSNIPLTHISDDLSNVKQIVTLNNPVDALGIIGSGNETAKLQAILDKLPRNVTLNPDKVYNTSGKLFVKSDCVIDGQGATINCTAPISTPEMIGSDVAELVKGAFTITVVDSSKFSIFDDILVYYNEDNSDTWYTNNQLNLDELGITTQKNQILGISGNVLTLKHANESKLSSIAARVSTVYKIPQNNIVVKNITFNVNANSWGFLRCAGIRFENCRYRKVGGNLVGFSVQMGYQVNFLGCELGEGLALGFNYGSYNCYAQRSTFYAGRDFDGLLLTYAGSNFITSRDNKFLVRNSTAKLANSGLYWGAKSRYCHSYNDIVVGLDYGFRVMFGAQKCSINNMTTKQLGTYSGFVSYSGVEINNFVGYDKPIRTINAENLTIKGGFLFSTDKSTTPVLLDINRSQTSDIRNNYRIEGLVCEGKAAIVLGVNSFSLLNNSFKMLEHYASAISKDWIVSNNRAGSMFFSFARNFKLDNNIIDDALDNNAPAYGLRFRSNCHVSSFNGNMIKNQTLGIGREQETAIIYLAHGNNNIIAPTAMSIYVALPPNNAELNSLCGDGFKILHDNFFTKGGVWTKRNGNWVINTVDVTYDPPSLSAAGTAGASVTTTVTLAGAVIGDAVYASFNRYSADIEIIATVSSTNTVTVKFKNTGASPVDLASGTLTVKLI